MDRVRDAMLSEAPQYYLRLAAWYRTRIIFSLAEQGRIITATDFISVTDADATLQKMIAIIDTVKLAISDLARRRQLPADERARRRDHPASRRDRAPASARRFLYARRADAVAV